MKKYFPHNLCDLLFISTPAQPSDKKIHIEKLTELFFPWFSFILTSNLMGHFENLPCLCFRLELALLALACL